VASCSAQSYTPKYIAESGAVVNGMLNIPAFNGLLTIQNNLPAEDTSSPAIQTMIDAVNKYSPGTVSSPAGGPSQPRSGRRGCCSRTPPKPVTWGPTPRLLPCLPASTVSRAIRSADWRRRSPSNRVSQRPLTVVLSLDQEWQYTPLYGNGSFCGSSSS